MASLRLIVLLSAFLASVSFQFATALSLEEVADPELQKLIQQEQYVLVLFSKSSPGNPM